MRRRVRWRVTGNLPGWWSIGFGRMVAPLPRPKGKTIYVLHLLLWNFVVEWER